MNLRTFRQADSRWGHLPYPGGYYQMHNCGCGCCAVTFLCIQQEKYKNWTPKNTQPYMKQYAVKGKGTLWAGIPMSLRHYGFIDVQDHPQMSGAWKYLESKHRNRKMGVILFRSGSRGGVTWTSGGHFVAFIDYKVKNGKHYFLIRDSGARQHNGWYCYETTMRGLIVKIYTADIAKSHHEPRTYGGKFPVGTLEKGAKGEQVKRLQKYLNWYFGKDVLNGKGHFGSTTEKYVKKFQSEQHLKPTGRFGKKSLEKARGVKK